MTRARAVAIRGDGETYLLEAAGAGGRRPPAEVSHERLRHSGSLATSGPGPHRVDIGRSWQCLAGAPHSKTRAKEYNSTLSPFLTCVGLVYGALLGFTIVVAWEQFSSAEANVANEASTLTTMYRQTVGMPVPQQTEMRELLRKYATAVEGPEWNQQDVGGTTDTARDALTEMYRILGSEQSGVSSSPMSQEFSAS